VCVCVCVCVYVCVCVCVCVCGTEISVSAPRTWRDNSAETCGSYVKYCTHKLQNSARVGVTKVIHCIAVHGIYNAQIRPTVTTKYDKRSLRYKTA